jgi:hypothetical protein
MAGGSMTLGTRLQLVNEKTDAQEIVMSADELWDAVGTLSRVLREANRRHLPHDLYGKVDVARGIVLGMFSTAASYGVKS